MIYRTMTLSIEMDLNTVCRGDGMLFVRDGVGIAGRGIASVIAEKDLDDMLSAITAHAHSEPLTQPGAGPVVFGLVPFLPHEQTTFFLPRFTVAKHPNGTTTATLIGPTQDDLSDHAFEQALRETTEAITPHVSTNTFRVGSRIPVEKYLAAVTAARDAVRAGHLQKAVIARDIEVIAERPLDVHDILLRLRSSFGSSYRYFIGDMIGASPELLVSVVGRTVRSHPLAGTSPRTGDPSTDARLALELIASTKNQIEHRIVIDMVHDTLLPFCSFLDWEPEPSVVSVANVQHLGTLVEGALTEPAASVMTLVRALCPTPALGGFPTDTAIDFISRTEGFERGYYGGAVGWLDSLGNGTFAVTIRCAQLSTDRTTARLFAGGGIVADSEPLAELAETQAKFQAMLSAIIRP